MSPPSPNSHDLVIQLRSSDVGVVNNSYGKGRPPDIEQLITTAARYKNINRFGKMGTKGGIGDRRGEFGQ